MRISVVDSIIDESFTYKQADCLKWYRGFYRKSDFSEKAKATLLSFFNRTLPEREIRKAHDDAVESLQYIEQRLKKRAQDEGLNYDSLYQVTLKTQEQKNLNYFSIQARHNVSPLYARLLGWLHYKPAIPVLQAVLRDSLKMKDYACENKKELAFNCKLALARMGNKRYEKELINHYRCVHLDCSSSDFCDNLDDLFYINTRQSINVAIDFSKNNKKYSPKLSHCSTKTSVLLYLSVVIKNYPLEYMFNYKIDFHCSHSLAEWESQEFYAKQVPKLEKWLKKNSNSYEIDSEKLF